MAVVAGMTLPAAALAAGGATAASASGCAPRSSVISTKPVTTKLAGGATMRVWDTGKTSDPYKYVHIVAVRVPRTSKLYGRLMRAGSLTAARTPLQIAAPQHAARVVVNGSVFDIDGTGAPSGVEMAGGHLLKAGRASEPVVVGMASGRTTLARVRVSGTVTLPKHTLAVTGLNDSTVERGGVTVYTTSWGDQRRPSGSVDVVVTGGAVTSVLTHWRDRAQPVPTGARVLTANGSAATALAALHVGDKVTVTYKPVVTTADAAGPALPKTDVARDAIGYSSRIMHGGVFTSVLCTDYNETLRPRTGLGIMANGDVIAMVVSGHVGDDGYRRGGATVHQFASYLHALGARDAIDFDGGNSAEMLVRKHPTSAFSRMDRPITQYERAMPSCFAFETTKP